MASPVSGCGVNQKIAQMKLALSIPVARDVELYNSRLAGWNGQTIAKHTGLTSAAGIGEQDLSQYPITTAVISS